ncbi:hypothetical protein [Actinomadura harenae]|uniref:Uncharacterized protein n=1 Tax=Actinomadura harenae TaxID=2483351 RepID=A0A3M2LVJ0_9ACTN|nr:hypothetical protein [Actinomadura harenae]RMI40920.1 hypothetical protein EBO15_25015 [Actinomadura harenae]
MGDAWLAPDTCGVKLAEFEAMTRQMTRAAPALATLADQLWQTLHAAGVSTAPALEIRRLAAWATDAASDLRRRNLLAHDMDRRTTAPKLCAPDGTYLTLPDRFGDQVSHFEGISLADVLRRAAAGDRSAWKELDRIRPEDVTPAFAKALTTSLGADGLLAVPVALAERLAADMNLEPADGSLHLVSDTQINADAERARGALSILTRCLALTTDPQGKGSMGDQFLIRLREAGRSRFTNGVDGYQSLSTLLAADATTAFSPAFFRVIGHDMIAYDRDRRKTSPDVVTDLSGHFHLGNALDAGTTKVVRESGGLLDRHDVHPQREILSPLLETAAHSGRDAAQTLLTGWHGPFAPKDPTLKPDSDLYYLIHDLRHDWGRTDHGKSLGNALRTATTSQDEASTTLTLQAAKVLADDARTHFGVDVSGNRITIGDGADDLAAMRPAMADVLAQHIGKVQEVYRFFQSTTREEGATPLRNGDLDYALLDICRDANAYDTLLKAQVAHARIQIDRTIAEGQDLPNALKGEGRMLGHLIEARNRAVGGEKARLAEDLARLNAEADRLTGLIPVAGTYARYAATLPKGEQAATWLTGKVMAAMKAQVVQHLAEKPDPTVLASKDNAEAVERLFTQMVTSSLVEHGKYSAADVSGQPFADPTHPGKIKAIDSMSGTELNSLLSWANESVSLGNMSDDLSGALERGRVDTSGHYRDDSGDNLPPSVSR